MGEAMGEAMADAMEAIAASPLEYQTIACFVPAAVTCCRSRGIA
jgi:hypothetical protein